MTEFEVDEEYIEEVNTSYDQDKEIGSIPSAYFAHSQPMNAKNGGDEKFESRDQQKWYYATDQTYLDDEPHENRKVEGEKLNKDGTGVKRATRGLDPKKTKAKVLQFVYVSKSECEICRQYDGMAFATDSPNRPIIPRLESQGKKGTRPYTHPNCKCKWVRPFSDAGIKNFDDMGLFDDGNKSLGYSGEAEAHELKQKTIDSIKKEYGSLKFDEMNKEKQLDVIISSLLKKLQVESFDPTSLPIASMIKMTYDAIEPTLALQLAKMSHRDSNEVRDLIDDMVGESLSSERKHSIVLEHNLDFTFENLLKLTVTALEHDVWDENTNTLVDPTLLEDGKQSDKSESDEGEFGFTDDEWNGFPEEIQDQLATKVFKKEGLDDEEQYMPDVYNIDPYPHRHEFIDNVCIICDYVLKASEYHPLELDIVQKYEGSPIQVKNNMAKNMGFKNWKEMIGKLKMRIKLDENGDTFEELSDAERNAWLNIFELDPNTSSLYESKANEGGRGSGRKGHQKWMLGAEADPEECPNCMIFTEKKNGNCQICGNSY